MRSSEMLSNEASRRVWNARRTSSGPATRSRTSSRRGANVCAPSETLVTPPSRRSAASSGVTVSGFASTLISAAAGSDASTRRSASGSVNDGVPPPTKTVVDVAREHPPLTLQLDEQRIDVGAVLLVPADDGDEVAVAAAVRAERQVHVEVTDVRAVGAHDLLRRPTASTRARICSASSRGVASLASRCSANRSPASAADIAVDAGEPPVVAPAAIVPARRAATTCSAAQQASTCTQPHALPPQAADDLVEVPLVDERHRHRRRLRRLTERARATAAQRRSAPRRHVLKVVRLLVRRDDGAQHDPERLRIEHDRIRQQSYEARPPPRSCRPRRRR